MAGNPQVANKNLELAREKINKGGRPKGSKASHTLKAEAAKALLVEMYIAQARPIHQALIDKAMKGDVASIRELYERVHGRSAQPITGADGGDIVIKLMKYAEAGSGSTS